MGKHSPPGAKPSARFGVDFWTDITVLSVLVFVLVFASVSMVLVSGAGS